MNNHVHDSTQADRVLVGSGDRIKRSAYVIAVTTALGLGVYSLFLASANAGKVKPLSQEDLLRTASAGDNEQIAHALGNVVDTDLVYVVVSDPLGLPHPEQESVARAAARDLVDSGLVVTVRRLEPIDPYYSAVVAHNQVSQFPAVLLVKRDGGIVLVKDPLDPDKLLLAYHEVWGKKSDCGAARNAIY